MILRESGQVSYKLSKMNLNFQSLSFRYLCFLAVSRSLVLTGPSRTNLVKCSICESFWVDLYQEKRKKERTFRACLNCEL